MSVITRSLVLSTGHNKAMRSSLVYLRTSLLFRVFLVLSLVSVCKHKVSQRVENACKPISGFLP